MAARSFFTGELKGRTKMMRKPDRSLEGRTREFRQRRVLLGWIVPVILLYPCTEIAVEEA